MSAMNTVYIFYVKTLFYREHIELKKKPRHVLPALALDPLRWRSHGIGILGLPAAAQILGWMPENNQS
jgi:hypothetical protein